MTIKELIEKLQSFQEDTKIVVAGYEGGFNDVSTIHEIKIKEDVNKEWFYGAHEESDDGEGICAVSLMGENKIAED